MRRGSHRLSQQAILVEECDQVRLITQHQKNSAGNFEVWLVAHDLVRLCPSIEENLDHFVHDTGLGWMAACDQESNRRGTTSVHFGGGVHVGSRIKEDLRDFGQI